MNTLNAEALFDPPLIAGLLHDEVSSNLSISTYKHAYKCTCMCTHHQRSMR